MQLPPLIKVKGALGGEVESWGRSCALHSAGTRNNSILLTLSRRHSAMLKSFLCLTPMQTIPWTSMLANMWWAWCSTRIITGQRGYWVRSSVHYTLQRRNTPPITENSLVSETWYCSGSSTYPGPSSRFRYIQTTWPYIGSLYNHTSPFVQCIVWRFSRILTRSFSTS
jgi:hypothetical protein